MENQVNYQRDLSVHAFSTTSPCFMSVLGNINRISVRLVLSAPYGFFNQMAFQTQ